MATGSLALSFTDLVLPGNAGMDLRIGRSYVRQQSRQWEFGIQGVATRVVYPDGISGGCCNPEFFTFDGNKHTAYSLGSGVYLTKELWRYTASTRKLQMPNGWTVSFESGTNTGGSMMTEIEDVFGNLIEATWNGSSSSSTQRPLSLDSVTQTLGPSQARTVDFEYEDATCPSGMPSKMIYDEREWNYDCEYAVPESSQGERLTAMTPPVGPGWSYVYEGDISTGKIKVTTPNGGWVRYEFEDKVLPSSGTRHRAVVKKRDIGGREISSAEWNFSFVEDSPGMVGIVTLPGSGSRSVAYKHELTSDEGWFLVGKDLRTGTSSPTVVSSLTRTLLEIPFVASSGTSLSVPEDETVVQDSRTYARAYDYHSTNYGDYGQAYQITETGEFTRVITREFDDSFTPVWLANRVSAITVTVGSEDFTDTWAHDGTTGFLENQTIRGVYMEFAPDAFGNRGSATDGKGHTTDFEYEWGTLKTITTEEGHVTSGDIDSDGTIASETVDGHTTTFAYDDLGRIEEVQPPLVAGYGDPTTTEYDATDGAWVKVSRGPTWTKTYLDGFGRPRGTENAVGIKTSITYDADGRVKFESQPFTGSSGTGETTTYDVLSRVSSVTHADSTVTNYAYSSNSSSANTVTTTDVFTDSEPDHVTVETWHRTGSPASGRIAAMVDADGQTWSYSYNALDLMTQVSQPGGSTRAWHYLSTGQLEYEMHPESGTTSYTYDDAGNLATRTDARSQTFTYSYDDDNRLINIATPSSSHDVMQDFSNGRSLRESVQTGSSGSLITTAFSYDAAGRLTSRVDTMGGHNFETEFEYDHRGNLSKLTYPSGREVRYFWDSADRLTDVGETTGLQWANDFSYHPSGALAGYTAANGKTVSVSYDARVRPTLLTSGPLSLGYSYWQSGNVKELTDARGSGYGQTLSYDKLDRLTSVSGLGSGSFAYDARGNRTSKNSTSYTYSGARLTSDGTNSYSYDNNGNTTAAGATTFTNTPFNMPATATTSSVTTTYRYDGDGERRVRVKGSTTEYFIPGITFEPLAEYKEVSGSLTLVREYIYANGQLIASEGPISSPLGSVTFTDEPLVANTTLIKAVHVSELRTAVNAARAAAGLTAASWTDSTLTAGTTTIQAVHIAELRTALNAAYTAFGMTAPSYTDSTLTAGTTLIKAAHIQELRAAFSTLTTSTLMAKAFYHLDAVGSVRAVTDAGGSLIVRHDFAPFGEELTSAPGLDARRFGGKDRDSETGLSYFGARFYSAGTGRFSTADDPIFGNPTAPQTLNQFGYTLGNPQRWADPSGHYVRFPFLPPRIDVNETVIGKLPSPAPTQDFEIISFAGLEQAVQRPPIGPATTPSTNCVVQAEFSAVGPTQATGIGALGVSPPLNSVAVSPAVFGFKYDTISERVQAQAELKANMGSITISAPGLKPYLGSLSTSFTIGDVGDRNIRNNILPRFDIYRFATMKAAMAFGRRVTTATISGLPNSWRCGK